MKRKNLEKVKKICDRLEYLEKRIQYLQSKNLESESTFIRFEGKISGGDRYSFDAPLGQMKGYIKAQIIQGYQAEKAALEKELAEL